MSNNLVRILEKARCVLMWALKIIVTILCPPAGLAWIFRHPLGIMVGVVVSMIVALLAVFCFATSVYDNPPIEIYLHPRSAPVAIVGVIACPSLFWFSPRGTVLKYEDNYYWAPGKDAIAFDREKDEYVLNFKDSNDSRNTIGSGTSVRDAEIILKRCLEKNNLIEIRKAKKALEEAKKRAEQKSESGASKSEKARTLFEWAVGKMNQEYREMQVSGFRDSNSQKN